MQTSETELNKILIRLNEMARGNGDPEADHVEADKLMVEALCLLGRSDIAAAFKNASQDFWYS